MVWEESENDFDVGYNANLPSGTEAHFGYNEGRDGDRREYTFRFDIDAGPTKSIISYSPDSNELDVVEDLRSETLNFLEEVKSLKDNPREVETGLQMILRRIDED